MIGISCINIQVDTSSIRDAWICSTYNKNIHPSLKGYIFVVDSSGIFLGVLTDGDIRRFLATGNHPSLQTQIGMILGSKTSYIFTCDSELESDIQREFINYKQSYPAPEFVKFTPVLTSLRSLRGVIVTPVNDPTHLSTVSIIGLGFVGLTLAAACAQSGMFVTGYDINSDIVDNLCQLSIHIKENGLRQVIEKHFNDSNLSFKHSSNLCPSQTYIVCVGSRISNDLEVDRQDLYAAASSIASVLEPGASIYLRSTVEIGFTRSIFIPLVESLSSLKAGTDFTVCFTPERTIEGDALNELRNLPQIIGGYSPSCLATGISFWSQIAKSTISMDSLEAAEIVKLANNSFRDLSFAFANQLALICSSYNIDAFDLITAANEGYPRNIISLPSPGVGGYCLSKDPLLLTASSPKAILSKPARHINKLAALLPTDCFSNWIGSNVNNKSQISVAILGITFKGDPPNTDVRQSPSISTIDWCYANNCVTHLFDAVVPDGGIIGSYDCQPMTDLSFLLYSIDAIFVLNNNKSNSMIDLSFLTSRVSPLFFYDGWHQFSFLKNCSSKLIAYYTLGLVP